MQQHRETGARRGEGDAERAPRAQLGEGEEEADATRTARVGQRRRERPLDDDARVAGQQREERVLQAGEAEADRGAVDDAVHRLVALAVQDERQQRAELQGLLAARGQQERVDERRGRSECVLEQRPQQQYPERGDHAEREREAGQQHRFALVVVAPVQQPEPA